MCVCVYLTYFCLVFGAPPNSNEVLGFFKLKYHFILAPVILPSACFYLDCLSVLLKGERPHFTLQCLHVIDNTFKTKENYSFLMNLLIGQIASISQENRSEPYIINQICFISIVIKQIALVLTSG